MEPTAEEWQKWETAALLQVGAAVRAARARTGLSQRALAEAAGVDRGQIANIESVNKDGTPRLSDLPRLAILIRLAVALHVPPVMLLYPGFPDGDVQVTPGLVCTADEAVQWFAGESTRFGHSTAGKLNFFTGTDTELMRVVRERRKLQTLEISATRLLASLGEELSEQQRKQVNDIESTLRQLNSKIEQLGGTVADDD